MFQQYEPNVKATILFLKLLKVKLIILQLMKPCKIIQTGQVYYV